MCISNRQNIVLIVLNCHLDISGYSFFFRLFWFYCYMIPCKCKYKYFHKFEIVIICRYSVIIFFFHIKPKRKYRVIIFGRLLCGMLLYCRSYWSVFGTWNKVNFTTLTVEFFSLWKSIPQAALEHLACLRPLIEFFYFYFSSLYLATFFILSVYH